MDNIVLTDAQTKFLGEGTYYGYGENLCCVASQSVIKSVRVGDLVSPVAFQKNGNIFQPDLTEVHKDLSPSFTTPVYFHGTLKNYKIVKNNIGQKVYDLGGFYILHSCVIGCRDFLVYVAHNGHLVKLVSKNMTKCIVQGVISKL